MEIGDKSNIPDTPELRIINFDALKPKLQDEFIGSYNLYKDGNTYLLNIGCAETHRVKIVDALCKMCVQGRKCLYSCNTLDPKTSYFWIKVKGSTTDLIIMLSGFNYKDDLEDMLFFGIDRLFYKSSNNDGYFSASWLAMLLSFLPSTEDYDYALNYIASNCDCGNIESADSAFLRNIFYVREGLSTVEVTSDRGKITKDFWDWAFANAPKALLEESFNMLYSNLHAQYDKYNQ